MSRSSPRPLALALEGLTQELAPATTLARVQQAWERAAGATIASAGSPVAERDGTLTIACSDSVWAAELDMMGAHLIERLNDSLGEELVLRLRCHTR
jgi:predicted nucleic acid-binding Zn ribbon protein